MPGHFIHSFATNYPRIPSQYIASPCAHLHVSLQLQQVKSVPGDKTGTLVGKVHPAKANLVWPHEGFADWVVVGPNKIVVNGDVLKLRGVSIWSHHLLVPADETKRFFNLLIFLISETEAPSKHTYTHLLIRPIRIYAVSCGAIWHTWCWLLASGKQTGP